jgi:hypothetical protein
LSSLFEAVRPRGDVLAGELTEARFAAGLEEVVDGTAPDTYADPAAFFASTYPSAGLRTLLNEALGRLGGGKPDGASVIRLETNLGGGKTHNLIGLLPRRPRPPRSGAGTRVHGPSAATENGYVTGSMQGWVVTAR